MYNDDFSMINTYGKMIINQGYGKGYRDFAKDLDTRDAFVYKALSAVGSDIGDTLYLNIKKYIDLVADVNLCKLTGLRSMLNILGFRRTIFDNLGSMPLGIRNLMDLLSINRKYLLKKNMLRKDLFDDLFDDGEYSSHAKPIFIDLDDRTDIKRFFTHNAYTLCVDNDVVDYNRTIVKKLEQTYNCEGTSMSNAFDRFENIPESTVAEISAAQIYMAKSGYFIAYGELSGSNVSAYQLYNDEAQKLVVFNESEIDSLHLAGDTYSFDISGLYDFAIDNAISDADFAFMLYNKEHMIHATLSNSYFSDDLLRIDDIEYQKYLKYIYAKYIGQQLSNVYNANFINNTYRLSSYIYPHLGEQYFADAIQRKYDTFRNIDDEGAILSLKMFYHVPKSFNEVRIYDDIENGDDDIDNYAGAELSILLEEKKRRDAPLDFTKLTEFGTYGIEGNSSKIPQTRYSYYREKQVAEYAKFVDNYYASIELSGDIYDFDNNFFVLNPDISRYVITIHDARNPDPSKDIDWAMVDVVADYLASLTLYASKIREKIKLQTSKNYMKGTNLLIIYIINEYLNEYAKHNRSFFLAKKDEYDAYGNSDYKYPELALSVYPLLDGHQFSDDGGATYSIEVGEYYDKTEYFNISTETSFESGSNPSVNRRYWELTSVSKPSMMGYDGMTFKLGEIEKFYLSTLNLKQTIEDSHDGMVNFLSTLYDLGASTSFKRDSDGLFSSMLESGDYAHEIYQRLIDLSNAFNGFREYLSAGNYDYIDGDVSSQVSAAINTYIFPNLSNEWLSAVSTVYKANIGYVNDVSNDMMRLSSDYCEFISGTYSYYYVKSNHKWCYEYQSTGDGNYMFNYYVKSPEYDTLEMTLHQHLQSLLAYSSDPNNIQNHALNCITDYIYTNFTSISSNLKTYVINSLQSEYNFVDIAAPQLDGELQYTYDYVQDLIATRKKTIENAISNLKTQATNLKTQYESLNNTFTTAIASFNDNNEDYTLGDSNGIVYQVSKRAMKEWPSDAPDHDTFELDEEGSCHTVTDRPTKGSSFVLYVKEMGAWYVFDGTGGYKYHKNKLNDDLIYNSEGTLIERCTQVSAYMNMPTTINEDGTETFGLKNEGTAAVIDNVIQGLKDIDTAFDGLEEQASEFGLDTGWEATDIYAKINELLSKLNSLDANKMDDAELNNLNDFIRKIIQLSSQYLPLKTQYESIFTDSEQASYLVGFQPNMELTLEHVQDVKNYRERTDAANYIKILDQVHDLVVVRFDALMDKLNLAIGKIIESGLNATYPNDNTVEWYIDGLINVLTKDIVDKTEYGMNQININKSKIFGYIAIMYSEIVDDIFTKNGFEPSVKAALARLNFFDHEIYQKWKATYLTYGGKDICYDPYYNIKNQVHASYQVHPFLWNLVKKASTDTLIERGFKAALNIGDDYTIKGLETYIGDFGQSINLWTNYQRSRADYSGYVTRYERSDNKSPATGDVNEVVDYDGAFYPPAIEEFRLNPVACINSVRNRSQVYDVQLAIANALTDDISCYITVDENSGCVIKNNVYDTIRAVVENHVISNNIDANLIDYFDRIGSNISSATMSDVKAIIGYDLNSTSTFYQKYYKHLSLSNPQYSHIADQLAEYQNQILDITNNATPKSVYDIYKYGLDEQGNSYILYKKYDYDIVEEYKDMSFKQKQDTLGTMWIRLAHHPIAFPAFSGKNPAYYIYKTTAMNPALVKLADMENGITYLDKHKVDIVEITSNMKFFYDFEFSQDGTSLIYIIKNGNMPNRKPFNEFGLAWVITDRIHSIYIKKQDLEWLQFTNTNSMSQTYTIDYIDFDYRDGRLTHYRNRHDLLGEQLDGNGVRYPVLVGYYPYDQYSIDLVYVYKKYRRYFNEDGVEDYEITISNMDDRDAKLEKVGYDLDKAFFIVQIKNGTTITTIPTSGATKITAFRHNNLATLSGVVCAGWDNTTRNTKLAFLTQLSSGLSNIIDTKPTISTIDFDENTEGALINDPMAPEMNSHDVFNQNVTIVAYKHKTSQLAFETIDNFNINADISYIPSYPGISGEIDIYNKYSSKDNYYNIQLMGMSKDLDYYISLVNPNPNPYFDYDSIVSSIIFGRVWEDYDSRNNEDKTFVQLYNPSLNKNMPVNDGSYTSKYALYDFTTAKAYELTWSLDQLTYVPFNQHDYETLEILIFNTRSLGKNPYFIGKLKDLFVENLYDEDTWIQMNYCDASKYANVVENEISVASSVGHRYIASGVRQKLDTTSNIDSNRIDHIVNMKAAYQGTVLKLRFYYDDFEYVHVPKNDIKIVLFNSHDLTLFKYYHMLDAHGAIQCTYLEQYLENPNIEFDGWGIAYDQSKYGHNQLSDLMKSYYFNASGHKEWLADIELSNYDALSDVYVLNGTNRLGFKVDEEIYFDISSDLYWYPTLNISYPRMAGEYIVMDQSFQRQDSTDLNILGKIYDNYNMFIIDIDNPYEVLQNIGQVDIPLIYNDVDDVRVYEDYLDSDMANGIPNYEKYDIGDSRLLEFAHVVSQNISNTYTDSKLLTIDESKWKNIAFHDVDLNLTDASLSVMTSEDESQTNGMEFVSINPLSDNCDISEQLKIYASYKRDRANNDSLTLYFNYFNYFNSPYLKIENGCDIKIDTIDGTYLKLKAGEDGILDLVVQFRYYNGGQLTGYKNCKILSYHIYNISDDKPKFLIQKIFHADRDAFKNKPQRANVKLALSKAHDIDLDENTYALVGDSNLQMPIYLNVNYDAYLSTGWDFYMYYPNGILSIDTTPIARTVGYYFDEEECDNGILHVVVNNPTQQNMIFNFYTIGGYDNLLRKAHRRFEISLDEPTIFDMNENRANVNYDADVTFTVKKDDDGVLAANLQKTKNEISAIIIDRLNNLVQID